MIEGEKPSVDEGEKAGLTDFHRTISEQLNARLSESPRFFGALVVVSTGYGLALWNFESSKKLAFVLASAVMYFAILWSVWYLAALGYAFRYLQNSQHRIEDRLGWAQYRTPKTGDPPTQLRTVADVLWLLPGIYHAHAFGLVVFLLIVVITFSARLWPDSKAAFFAAVALAIGIAFAWRINLHYLKTFRARHLRSGDGTTESRPPANGIPQSSSSVADKVLQSLAIILSIVALMPFAAAMYAYVFKAPTLEYQIGSKLKARQGEGYVYDFWLSVDNKGGQILLNKVLIASEWGVVPVKHPETAAPLRVAGITEETGFGAIQVIDQHDEPLFPKLSFGYVLRLQAPDSRRLIKVKTVVDSKIDPFKLGFWSVFQPNYSYRYMSEVAVDFDDLTRQAGRFRKL